MPSFACVHMFQCVNDLYQIIVWKLKPLLRVMGKDVAGGDAEKFFAGYAVLFQHGIIHICVTLAGKDIDLVSFFFINGIRPIFGAIKYAEE